MFYPLKRFPQQIHMLKNAFFIDLSRYDRKGLNHIDEPL